MAKEEFQSVRESRADSGRYAFARVFTTRLRGLLSPVHTWPMSDLKYDDHRPFPVDYPRVRISKDMEVTSPLGVSLHGHKEGPLLCDLRAVVEVVEGRFAITELVLTRVEDGPPIGSGLIAKLKVWDFIYGSVFVSNSLVFITKEFNGYQFTSQASGSEAWQQELHELQNLDSPRSDLAALARFYRLSRLGHYDPTETVASALQVNSSTVRRWLADAVAAGELTQDERRK